MFWFACKLFGGIALVAAAIVAFVVYQYSFGKGLTGAEMDWNKDGSTSLLEIFAAESYGLSKTQRDGRECRRIFAYKDGATLNDTCGDAASAQ